MRIPQLLIVIVVPLVAISHAQRPSQFYALVGARVHLAPGRVIDNGVIVLRDGLLEQVGLDLTPPPGARVIDGKGLVAYPGFIDGGAQFGLRPPDHTPEQDDPLNRQEDAQVAMRVAWRRGLRPELRAAQWLTVDDNWRRHRQAGFTTALIEPTGGLLNGQSALINLNGEAKRTSLIRAGTFQHVTLAPLGGFGAAGGYPSTLMGALTHARQFLLDAQWHRNLQAAFERKPTGRRPPVDEALESVFPALDGEESVVFRAESESDIRRALKFADEFHLKAIIAGGTEAWKLANELKRRGVPVIVGLNFGVEPGATPPPPTASSRPPRDDLGFEIPEAPARWRQEQKRVYDEKLANAGKLRAAGVVIALTTAGLPSMNEFTSNLQKAIKAGLKHDDALAALTVSPAKLFGQAQLGELRAGAIGNVTVLTVALDAAGVRTKYLFIDGKLFEPEKESPPPTPPIGIARPGEDGDRR